MGPIAEPTVPFAAAARAAGISTAQLRNWTDRKQVRLQSDDERGDGRWRQFSLVDVARLAVIGTLVRYGLPVQAAHGIVDAHIDWILQRLAKYRSTPPEAISAALNGALLLVEILAPGGTEVAARLVFPAAEEDELQHVMETSPHFLWIAIGRVVADALARLGAEEGAGSFSP